MPKKKKKVTPESNPVVDRLWKNLAEIDFFMMMPPEHPDNRIYRTETKHILQLRGDPVESFELGIYVDVGMPGVSDFLRLGVGVLKAIDPDIQSPVAWLGSALTLCENSSDDKHEQRMNGWTITIQVLPELGYVMIVCTPVVQLTPGVPSKKPQP